jgi:hypothetical protein
LTGVGPEQPLRAGLPRVYIEGSMVMLGVYITQQSLRVQKMGYRQLSVQGATR